MNRDTEVRVFVADNEFELRPLSAHALLSAKRESRALADEYGGGIAANEIALKACIAAEGLHLDGKRFFSSGRDALNGMTAEELLVVTPEYGEASFARDADVKPERALRGSEKIEEPVNSGNGHARDGDVENENRITAAADDAKDDMAERTEAIVWDRLPEYEGKPESTKELPGDVRSGQKSDAPEPEADRRLKMTADFDHIESQKERYAEDTAFYRFLRQGKKKVTVDSRAESLAEMHEPHIDNRVYARNMSARAGVERLSDFIERDSRRYDSEFLRY